MRLFQPASPCLPALLAVGMFCGCMATAKAPTQAPSNPLVHVPVKPAPPVTAVPIRRPRTTAPSDAISPPKILISVSQTASGPTALGAVQLAGFSDRCPQIVQTTFARAGLQAVAHVCDK